jgi:hypothetical protein
MRRPASWDLETLKPIVRKPSRSQRIKIKTT